jgi:hypothetical protein
MFQLCIKQVAKKTFKIANFDLIYCHIYEKNDHNISFRERRHFSSKCGENRHDYDRDLNIDPRSQEKARLKFGKFHHFVYIPKFIVVVHISIEI